MYHYKPKLLLILFPSAKVRHSPHTTKSVQPIPKIFQPISVVSEIFSIFAPKIKNRKL